MSRAGYGECSVAEQVIFCQGHLDRGPTLVGAFVEGRLVRIGLLTPDIRPRLAQLAYLQVSFGYRRLAIGSRLTSRLLELARELGATRIYVSATPSEWAVGFYRSFRFTPLADPLPDLYTLEPDDIHMSLELDHRGRTDGRE